METTHTEETKALYEWDLDTEQDFSLDLDYYDEKKQEDKLWQARTGLNPETLCGAIETLIFMSDRPLALNKIRAQIDEDIPLRVLHESLSRLQDEYESKHHGIRLLEVAEGYQFRTKPAYSKFVQDLFKVNSLVLSPTSLEVLSIIAYQQPISKNDVEKIRGVDSSHIIRGLMDKRLVKMLGRSEEMGRPSLYGTTLEFLEVFNLKDLSELPSEHELQEIAEGDRVGDINEIRSIVASEKKSFEYDEIVELDELATSIRSISSDTDFLRSLKAEDKKRKSDDGEVIRSAFDILEDYIRNDEIVVENKSSSESDVLTSAADVNVVSLEALSGDSLLNAPEQLDEEEELIIDEVNFDSFTIDPEEAELSVNKEFEEIDVAIEDAFSKLLEAANPAPSIEDQEQKLSEVTDNAINKACELGIDLNFLQSDETDTSQDDQNDIE